MTRKFRLLTMAAMMLLPLAACDEGSDTTTPVGIKGTISGTVTIQGETGGVDQVTVTLSNGTTTKTSASGAYSFSGVAAGNYIVSISGFPADASFSNPSAAAVIATADQVVPVNFTGSRIRTSIIAVSVTSGATGLSGVTVTLTGPDTKTGQTDATGQFLVGGLRAGTYTVAISGTPSTVTCAPTSLSVLVPAGESRVAAFPCTANSTGKISGVLFLDENNKNDVYDGAALEDNMAAANVLLTLTGPTIGTTKTTQSTATGTYEFTGLAAGTYTVTVDAADPDIAPNTVYGGVSATSANIVLAAGGTGTANFPFDITTQTIKAYAFMGDDARTLPVGAPVKDVIIGLYPTQLDAAGSTNRIRLDTTDATGEVQFTFLRSADTSPGGAAQDQIVYAKLPTTAAPDVPADLTVNGEQIIEIKYSTRLRTDLAKDTFDMLSAAANVKSDGFSIAGDTLVAWGVDLYTDTTLAPAQSAATTATGRASFAPLANGTYFVRLRPTGQVANNGHAFTTTNVAGSRLSTTLAGSYLRFVVNGITRAADTVDVGDHNVKYSDSDIMVRAFHETNDTANYQTAGATADDPGFFGVANMMVGLRYTNAAGTVVNVAEQAPNATGQVTFLNIPTGRAPYILWTRTTVANEYVLKADTLFNVGATGGAGGNLQTGGKQVVNVCPLSTSQTATGCGTFAFKYEDGAIAGSVTSAGGVAAQGMKVRIQSLAPTIQPRPTDTTITVNAGGTYGVSGLREGLYSVSILRDSVTTAGDSIWASLTNAKVSGTIDVQGPANFKAQNFIVVRMDTKIEGVVVNDRDQDANTADPGEALSGSTIKIYRDGSGAITLDTLVCTTTTLASTGSFSCGKLREGTYAIQVTQQAGSKALRKYSATGAVVDTAIVTTTATVTGAGTNVNNVNRVGSLAPNPLPLWNYTGNAPTNTAPSHFTFLYSTGTVTGTVTLTAGGAAIPGMSMTINRCQTQTAAVPASGSFTPVAGNCTAYFPGYQPITVVTDATGKFTFSNLDEGVYEVTSTPSSGNPPQATTTPSRMLYMLLGANDVETGNFVAP